ncbi:hypothetical protein [Sphingobacterium pedocola]|nr:hypothetical protein [Sphingobacterium pedocola]
MDQKNPPSNAKGTQADEKELLIDQKEFCSRQLDTLLGKTQSLLNQ